MKILNQIAYSLSLGITVTAFSPQFSPRLNADFGYLDGWPIPFIGLDSGGVIGKSDYHFNLPGLFIDTLAFGLLIFIILILLNKLIRKKFFYTPPFHVTHYLFAFAFGAATFTVTVLAKQFDFPFYFMTDPGLFTLKSGFTFTPFFPAMVMIVFAWSLIGYSLIKIVRLIMRKD